MLMKGLKHLVWGWLLMTAGAQASVINESHVVAADAATAALAPAAKTVTIAAAGAYTVTLNDVGKQNNAAFSALSLVITQGDQLIKLLSVAESTASSATASVTLSAGTYTIQVLGVTTTAGLYSANIADASNASVWSDAGTVTAVTTTNVSPLEIDPTLTAGQSYTIELSDRMFPAALDALQLLVVVDSTPVAACTLSAGGSCQFTAGTMNQVFIVSDHTTAGAGLLAVKITAVSSGAAIVAETYAVGNLSDPVSITLPSTASNYSLAVNDLATPAALSSLQAVLVEGADLLATNTTTGTFGAAQGTAKLYVIATANSSENAGIYAVQLKQGSTALYTNAVPVTTAGTTTSTGFTFKFTASAAGSYTVNLTDFNFPQALSPLSAAISQNGSLMASLTAAGSKSVSLSAGEVQIAVLAAPGASAQGLFGLSVAAAASTTDALDVTQGVGGSFTTIPVTLGSTGAYKLNVTDLAAPQALAQLYVVATRGSQSFGTIYGGTTTASTTLNITSAGDYTLNIIANTKSGTAFGMYGISLSAAPVMTFAANQTTISAGSSVTLTWSASDATSCSASGGWSGVKATSGTQTFGPVNASVALTLTCDGLGGSSAKTLNLSVASSSSSASHHGGGALSWGLLIGLLGLGSVRMLKRV